MGHISTFGATVFQNAEILYDTLLAKSQVVPASVLVPYGYPSDGDDATVFYGLAIRETAAAGLQKSAHGHAMTLLKSMQAIEKLKTGNHSIPSIYVLNYKPTMEQFRAFKADVANTSDHIAPSKFDVMKHDLSDARVRIRKLEAYMKEALEKSAVLEEAFKDLHTKYFELIDSLGKK